MIDDGGAHQTLSVWLFSIIFFLPHTLDIIFNILEVSSEGALVLDVKKQDYILLPHVCDSNLSIIGCKPINNKYYLIITYSHIFTSLGISMLLEGLGLLEAVLQRSLILKLQSTNIQRRARMVVHRLLLQLNLPTPRGLSQFLPTPIPKVARKQEACPRHTPTAMMVEGTKIKRLFGHQCMARTPLKEKGVPL